MKRLARLTPLTGLIFAALIAVNTAIAPNNPNAKTTGEHVIAFFTQHHSAERAGAVVGTLGLVFFIFFAGWLYNRIRETDSRALGIVALVGGGLFAAGFLVSGSIVWALSDSTTQYSAPAAQALNALDYDLVLPMIGGLIVFAIATGIAVLREGWLPAWLGWALVALGIIAPSPAFPIALFGTVIWSAIVAVINTMRSTRGATAYATVGNATA